MENGQHIVVYGSPSTGFTFIGPFDSGAEALEYADADNSGALEGQAWWIAPLEAPEIA